MTFLAASGDSGGVGGNGSYPAYSPNVIAVGGTTLAISSDGQGNPIYGYETGWPMSGGGQSRQETEPTYQRSVQTSGMRESPDVAFDADPNTCAWAYWYYKPYEEGWFYGDGTSLACQCWGGLIAIADQMRVANGLTTLDGPTQTLPALYAMPSTDFHDIAPSGYDMVTGRGTPVANLLVPALAASFPPDLTVSMTDSGAGKFYPGDVGDTYTITVTNSGTGATNGTVSLTDTLPAGLTATGFSGTGWTVSLFNPDGQPRDALAAGSSYPVLTLTVNVATSASGNVTNTATVSGGGETNTSNDTASDTTSIAQAIVATGGFAVSYGQGKEIPSTTVVATFTDPSGAQTVGHYSASIDWGDETALSTGSISVASGVFTVKAGAPGTAGHTYSTMKSPYTVLVNIVHNAMLPVAATDTAYVTGPHTMVWGVPSSGNWTTIADWKNQSVPPYCPNATIDVQINTAETVTVSDAEAANSLTLSNGATVLLASGGTLSLSSLVLGTGAAPTILLEGGTLNVTGAFTTAVPITIGTGGGTVNTNGYDVTLAGKISDLATPGITPGGWSKWAPAR